MKSTLSPGFTRKTSSGKIELGFQSTILKSARAAGGYGRKIAHFQLRGISDLLIQLPGFCMVQVECKDMATVIPSFDRQSDVTQHQHDHMEALVKAAGGRNVAFVAIRYVLNGEDFMTLMPWSTTRVSLGRMREDVTVKLEGKIYPYLPRLWSNFGVPRLGD